MFALIWVFGLVTRRTLRIIGTAAAVAMTVAMFASLGAFFAASKAHMTRQAAAGVPVDWQVQLAPGASPASAGQVIAQAQGVTASLPVSYASTTGLAASTAGTTQTTGPGKVLGIAPNYAVTFPGEIRFLVGAHSGVLIAQQTAANLHATVGSLVIVGRQGASPVRVRVDGIVDLPAADSLFQAVGAAPGTSLQAPPDNVLLLPQTLWRKAYGAAGSGQPSSAATYLQYHVRLSADLPPDPAAAFTAVTAGAKNLEARLAGGGLVGNNIAAQLDAARTDAVFAQLLFLFLGLPGIVLAGLLTGVIGATGGDRRRREQALLRVRGASPARILRLAGAEALLVGVLGVGLGLVGADVAGHLAFGAVRFGATTGQSVLWGAAAVTIGLALAAVTILVPAVRDTRTTSVRVAREIVGPARRPLWVRLYVDFWLLAAAAVVFWRTVQSGYQVVVAPEGVATISVSYSAFLAPFLFWVGAALLCWRISHTALGRGRPAIARVTRPLAGALSSVVAASMSRQRRLLSRGLMIMALTASFAVSTAVFNATYAAQSRVDAQLTNGADVMASTTATTGLPPGLLDRTRRLRGVAAVQPMMHRFAYVGNDLQDLFGISPQAIGTATPMSDAFFQGGHADAVLAALGSRPDAVLVSAETVRDFQLRPGDLIRLRLQSAVDHAYHLVPFHYVGIVREFPTAPRDSFFVANASYVARASHSRAYQVMLVRASGPPPTVAAEIRGLLGPASGAVVHDIDTELRATLSGLTALDLSGLTSVELAFAFILAAAASGLVLGLGLIERRRTFAIASALGARTRQLASFVWAEAIFVTIGGAVLGVLAGWALALIIVKILTGVFDPPPEHLSIPWSYLLALTGVTGGAIAAAGSGVLRATRRPAIDVVRDL